VTGGRALPLVLLLLPEGFEIEILDAGIFAYGCMVDSSLTAILRTVCPVVLYLLTLLIRTLVSLAGRQMIGRRLLFPLLLLLHLPTGADAFLFEAFFDLFVSILCFFFRNSCDDSETGAPSSSPTLAPSLDAKLSFQFEYIENTQGDFAIRGWLNSDSLFQQNIRAAMDIFAQVMDVSQDVTVNVLVAPNNNLARAGGTFSLGKQTGDSKDGLPVYEPGPVTKIRDGSNPGGPTDIFLYFDSEFLEANYWLDPTPSDRTDSPPPNGRTDFISIVLHESGHGLGMAGTRSFSSDSNYGDLQNYATTFDFLSTFQDGEPLKTQSEPNPLFFTGPKASAVYGGPVPVSQRTRPVSAIPRLLVYHFGTSHCGAAQILLDSLMNGCSTPIDGTYLELTAIEDLNYPIKPNILVRETSE